MAKITVEDFTKIYREVVYSGMTPEKAVELLNEKTSEPEGYGKLICPHCNSTNTDVVHAISYCECSDCEKEFEA